jgi:glycosyltransferase involved in cell wall biosynthesis
MNDRQEATAAPREAPDQQGAKAVRLVPTLEVPTDRAKPQQKPAPSAPRRPERQAQALLWSETLRFLARQVCSLRKRWAEARELWLRAAVRSGRTVRLRRLREAARLIRDSRLLDAEWYFQRYPEARWGRPDPVLHYLTRGADWGYDPNPFFETRWYADQNADVFAGGLNPLIHYLQVGWKEGREPCLNFHPRLYLQANPDVAAAGLEPLTHYLCHGMKEGRELEPATLRAFGHEPEDTSGWLPPDVRLIAFYLPQFHSIPENDAWWGKGFTDWTNVRRGRACFRGHYQPHVPHSSIGYYDLTDESVLVRQAEMARRFGIYGFCFHYYWFGGKRLLEMPVERLLRTGRPDFPFCLCWANENWTRRWDGMESEVLIAQKHSPADDEHFIREVLRAMRDRRYIQVNGRPLLIVYRPMLLPDPTATFSRWREVCRAEGVGEIFLAAPRMFGVSDPRPLGLDAAIQFPPHDCEGKPLPKEEHGAAPDFQGYLYDYRQTRKDQQARRIRDYRLFRGIIPSWDNTPRRQNRGTVFVNSSPQEYSSWLALLIRETRWQYEGEERLVFINAWNEWAEGCHLEPDERYGFAWLNATRRALLPTRSDRSPTPATSAGDLQARGGQTPVLVIGHDACRSGAQQVLLTLLSEWRRRPPFPFRLILVRDGVLRRQFESLCPTLVLADHPDTRRRQAVLKSFLEPRPCLIYSNTVVNGPLLEELRWLGCPVLTHVHELQKAIERWAPGDIMTATLRCTNHFIAACEQVADNLRSRHGVSREAIATVYEFVEVGYGEPRPPVLEDCEKDLDLREGDLVVFGCGTTDWRKGPDLFVEIAGQACEAEPRLCFFWIGGGSGEERHRLQAQICAKNLQGKVRFLGERPDPRAYLPLGDLFLLPSREDPFPLVALEAADAGLPIVCFEGAGGMPGFVGDECGFVVPFEDVAAAAGAVTRLARDPKLRLALGTRAKDKVASCHATPAAAARVATLIEQLVHRRAAPNIQPSRPDPLVSIVLPNYNHARFLPERLDSIQKQGVGKIEILLLDDASSDNSLVLLEGFAQREPRARLLANQTNSGSTFKQWKKGLAAAKGQYVWIAESDDSALPAFLETAVERLERNSEVALAYTQSRMVDERGNDLGVPWEWTDDISPERWGTDYLADGLTEIQQALSIKNTIPNASAVVFRRFPGIEEQVEASMRLCADWLFWVRLCGRGSVSYCAIPLNLWRQNTSFARTRPPGVLEWQEGRAVIENAAEMLAVHPAEKQRLLVAFEQRCRQWLARNQRVPKGNLNL